eukprot:m.661587 g.661587  ORF g.661587 m.661587 type:complete len:51 (+) comp22737_c0_seq45:1332-1484(+)
MPHRTTSDYYAGLSLEYHNVFSIISLHVINCQKHFSPRNVKTNNIPLKDV